MKKQNEKLANAKRTFTKDSKESNLLITQIYTNADGYLVGGVDIEMSNPKKLKLKKFKVKEKFFPEKKRSAKWY
jgi:hypothetical protein